MAMTPVPLIVARWPRGALPWIAPDLALQLDNVQEDVGLAAQLVGHHRRLRRDGGDHRYPHALALDGLDQRAEIAIAREQHDVVDMRRDLHRMHRKLDVHASLHLAAAGLV